MTAAGSDGWLGLLAQDGVGEGARTAGGGEGVETVDCSEVRNQNVREDIK